MSELDFVDKLLRAVQEAQTISDISQLALHGTGVLRGGRAGPARHREGVCTHMHICPVSHPACQLLRRKATHLQLVGVPSLGLPLGREVNEGGGRIHVQLHGESSQRIQPVKGLFSNTILCHF